jgi:hypothetical protein
MSMRVALAVWLLAFVTACGGSPATTAGGSSATTEPRTWWHPGPRPLPWQWELDHPLNLSSSGDMGTGVAAYGGRPAAGPVIYDIDGFENPAATVSALHARGDKAIC